MVEQLLPTVKEIKQILSELNSDGETTWVELTGYFTVQSCKIDASQKPNPVTLLPNGLVLKGFLNTNSGEIKFYLAKLLNVSERDALW